MKQKVFILILLVLFLVPAAETVAAPKPPSNICLELIPVPPSAIPFVMSLVVKSVGAMAMADGPTGFYAVNGAMLLAGGMDPPMFHMTGAGHMDKNTEGLFHFSVVSGLQPFSGNNFLIIYIEGNWNVVTKTGNASGRISSKEQGSPIEDHNYDSSVLEVPCKNLHLPSNTP